MMALNVMIGAQSKKLNFSVVDDEEDVIEKEQRMRKPLHKRLQYVAGWNIHDLVQDARKCRPRLHTREGFLAECTASEVASLFESCSVHSCRTGTASTKSSNRSSIATISSSASTTTFKSSRRGHQKSQRKEVWWEQGLTRSSSVPDANEHKSYDTMRFHHICGLSIELSKDRRTASRLPNTFCDGLVFGHRPVRMGETIHLRFNKVRPDWRGCIRLGFTHLDPKKFNPKSLPSFVRPDLTQKARFWGVPVKEKYATRFNIFSFVCKGLKTRLSSYTRRISRPPFLDDWLWKDMDAEDDTADAEEEWDPYDDVLTGLTDAETLDLFKSDDEEDEFDRF